MYRTLAVLCVLTLVSSKSKFNNIKGLKNVGRNSKIKDLKDVGTLFGTLERKLSQLSYGGIAQLELTKHTLTRTCPSGWTLVNDKCYYFPSYWKMDWSDAQGSCQAMGGHLVILDSDTRGRKLISTLEGSLGNREKIRDFWVGGFGYLTEDSWHWVDGQRINYTADWETFKGVDVVERNMYHRCLMWSDRLRAKPCFVKQRYLCEMELV